MTEKDCIDQIPHGTLEFDQQELENLTPQDQFTTYMRMKGTRIIEDVSNRTITSNIVQSILDSISNHNKESYERCFDMGGFIKEGGGYDKETFSRICI